MKNLILRSSLALACAAGLVACGGGDDELILQIRSINGLTKDGLTVRNNGGTPQAIPAASTYFNFPGLIGSDSDFNIEIVTQPPNATCVVYNGKGKTGSYSPNNIFMECTATPHNVTATVTGLTGTGLVVVNGTRQYPIPANTTSFSFTTTAADGTKSGQVGDGVAYGFVVLAQPSNPAQTCVVENGTGVMGNTDVVIAIKCT
jgi:hypothetical protein